MVPVLPRHPPPPPPIPSDNILRSHHVHPQPSHSRPHIHDATHAGVDRLDNRNQWLPKMNFPTFDGTDAQIWVDKCTAYFVMYQIPPGFRVSAASIYMTSTAAHWFVI
jgi:hypothetical protein